jgi:putative (di)nucleoside polyphosphate hydrolase
MIPFEERPYRPCVGIMLLNADGLVFVAQRIDQTAEAWQMPQGGIDDGEDPRDTALRELEEEIGTGAAEIIAETDGWIPYDLPRDIADKVWGGRFRGQTQKWFAMRFLGRDEDIDLQTEHPEFSAWKWAPPADLPDIIVPFKRDNYRQVLAAFRDILDGEP